MAKKRIQPGGIQPPLSSEWAEQTPLPVNRQDFRLSPLFCDFRQSLKIFQNVIAFVLQIDDTPFVATKKFGKRPTRDVRHD